MKMFIASIGIGIAVAVPTIFGLLPPIIGASALLMLIVIKDLIFAIFARGAPMELIKARMSGGVVLGIVKRTREIVFGRFHPSAGMINTGKHGSFNLMPERLYSLGGVAFGIAPEKIGYNVGVDHAQLVAELKKRGINKISEVCDVDEYGQVLNFKDDPRIKDLKVVMKPELTTFDDFYKYTTEAANPIHQDANIKLGIAQGLLGKEMGKIAWLIGAGVLIFLVCLGAFVLLQWGGGGKPVEIIIDNARHVISA